MLCSAVITLAGCAAPLSYMGVSLKPGAVDAAIQQQARQAMAGDKQAQLDLGIRFEEGMGVARDLTKAKKLYHHAASDSGGFRLLLVPGSSGLTTTVVGMGPKIDGNEAAQARLRRLTLSQKWNKITFSLGSVELQTMPLKIRTSI